MTPLASSALCRSDHIAASVALPPLDSAQWQNSFRAFAWGMRSVGSTVLALVLFATYLGIGALAHDTHFSLGWVLASTLLVWAGPAQIILISTLGSGATVVQAAMAVTVSAIRLFPMVVSVLPMHAHAADQTASSRARCAFHRRHAVGRMLPPAAAGAARAAHRLHARARLRSSLVCLIATTLGYQLAANLPPLFAAAILMLTPLAFLLSTARNCRQISDILALVLGLALYPLVSMLHTGVDILISGISAGTIAYGVHWWRERACA